MTQILWQVIVGWLFLSGVGLIVLSLLNQEIRERLAPGAATAGVIVLVLFLSLTTIVLPVAAAIPIFGILLAVGLVVAIRRGTPPWRLSRTAAVSIAGAAVIAIPAVVTVLGPAFAIDDSRVVTVTSHDAFYYVSVSEWLRDNPGIRSPTIADAPSQDSYPPAFGPAYNALRLHLRLGNELAQAGLNTLVNRPALETWTSWNALWILLVPGACVAAAGILGLRRLTGWILAGVSGTSALLLHQAHNQNSASLLAIAMAPLAIALVVTTLDARDPTPLLVAAAALTAWMGTYTEYAVVALPALGGAVLIRRWHDIPRALRRTLLLLGAAAVMGPLAWYNTVARLLNVGGTADDPDTYSPFLNASFVDAAGRLVGTASVDSGSIAPATTTVILLVPLVVGLILALALAPRRGLWWGLIAGGMALLTYTSIVTVRPYSQRRAVDMLLPLLLIGAAAGWDATVSWLERRQFQPVVAAAFPAIVLVGIGAIWYVVNIQTSIVKMKPASLAAGHVSTAFDDAAGWVRERAGPEGADVAVAVPKFFDQLWISHALRHEAMVEYPTVNPSYLVVSSYGDDTLDRYLLVGRDALIDVDDGVIVEANERFQLLDLARGEAVVAYSEDVLTDRSIRLLRTDGIGSVTLIARSSLDTPLGVNLRLTSGRLLLHQEVLTESTALVLEPLATAGNAPLLDMQIAPPPRIPAGATDLSIHLLGITREQ